MVSSVNKEKTRHRQVQVKPNGCVHPRYNYNTRPGWKFRSDLCRRCPWKLGLCVSSMYNSDSWAERLKRRENGSLFFKGHRAKGEDTFILWPQFSARPIEARKQGHQNGSPT